MKKRSFFILGAAVLFIYGCTTRTLDDVMDEMEPIPTGNVVTYQDIKPIIDNNCVQCHGNPPQNGAPMSLSTYSQVRQAVENRGLIDRISLPEGDSGLMPLGGPRLPQSSINMIIQWRDDGFPEN